MDDSNNLLAILDLEPIGSDAFRGRSPNVGWQRIFGGLVVAQALVATMRTVDDRAPHSLHSYFLLPGDPKTPILYEVDRIRDGRSFTTRRCVAIQNGRAIFTLAASFHSRETGFDHSAAMPEVPPPEGLESIQDLARKIDYGESRWLARFFEREQPFDIRPVAPDRYLAMADVRPHEARQSIWMRCRLDLPDDPSIHCAVLAYLSDMTLLDASLAAHGRSIFDPSLQVASLDHALWFHRPFRADDWLLYDQDSPSAYDALAFTRGSLFTRQGLLVASVCQEGLVRQMKPRA